MIAGISTVLGQGGAEAGTLFDEAELTRINPAPTVPHMCCEQLRACLLLGVLACAPSPSSGPKAGTLDGTIDSTKGSPIGAGVTVTATDSSTQMTYVGMTAADGTFKISAVPVGSGTIVLSTLPTGCGAPPPVSYTIVNNGGTKTLNFTVVCGP
jgi:hypothetical protein